MSAASRSETRVLYQPDMSCFSLPMPRGIPKSQQPETTTDLTTAGPSPKKQTTKPRASFPEELVADSWRPLRVTKVS